MATSNPSVLVCGLLAVVLTGIQPQMLQAERGQVPRAGRGFDAVLKQEPELSSGFTTPQGYRARVVRQTRGGVQIEYSGNGVKGMATVTGPAPAVGKGKGWVSIAASIAGGAAKAVVDEIFGDDDAGPSGGNKPKNCGTTVTIRMPDGTTVTLQSNGCSKA